METTDSYFKGDLVNAGKKIAISQSNYIPWKGYFDIINTVDEFILYDDVQFTKRDWRNRNLIKTKNGLEWLTISVEAKGRFPQKIREARISSKVWNLKHWKTIVHNYSRAKYFDEYRSYFEKLYMSIDSEFLSDVNHTFIKAVCDILDIKTRLVRSSDYILADGKTDRLVSMCKQEKASEYYTGPRAKDYIEEEKFKDAEIKLIYFDYSNYPEYEQLWGGFEHKVTILDLIFNEGPNVAKYMKSFK